MSTRTTRVTEIPALRSLVGTLAHNRSFTVQEIEMATRFERRHIAGHARAIVAALMREGLVQRVARGRYTPTSRGWAWIEERFGGTM